MKQTIIRMAGIAMLLGTVLMLNGIVSGELSLWMLPMLALCGLATAGVLLVGVQAKPNKRRRAGQRAQATRRAAPPAVVRTARPVLAMYQGQGTRSQPVAAKGHPALRVVGPARHAPAAYDGNYNSVG